MLTSESEILEAKNLFFFWMRKITTIGGTGRFLKLDNVAGERKDENSH